VTGCSAALLEKGGIGESAEEIRVNRFGEMMIKARRNRPFLVGGLAPPCERDKVRRFSP
jgi:hypothetical protein